MQKSVLGVHLDEVPQNPKVLEFQAEIFRCGFMGENTLEHRTQRDFQRRKRYSSVPKLAWRKEKTGRCIEENTELVLHPSVLG